MVGKAVAPPIHTASVRLTHATLPASYLPRRIAQSPVMGLSSSSRFVLSLTPPLFASRYYPTPRTSALPYATTARRSYASTYQMLRGTLVLFAGFFTIIILRRALYIHHWLGMVLITGGAALVGAASVLSPRHNTDGGGGAAHGNYTISVNSSGGAGGDGLGLDGMFSLVSAVGASGGGGLAAGARRLAVGSCFCRTARRTCGA